MSIETILRNYTKEELPIYSIRDYEEMKRKWPNEEEIEVYRGINFETESQLASFMKEFEENGGYVQGAAAGFAKTMETAIGFASTTKTYFPTLDVIERDSIRRALFEEMTGVGGIILKTTVKAGEVVDVTLSGQSVEDEVLFRPGQLIKCEIERLKNFQDIVNEKGFDKDKYVQENDYKNNKLAKFIIGNFGQALSEDSKNKIVDDEIKYFQNVIEKNWKSEKENALKKDSIKILDSDENWLTYGIETYDFMREKRTKSLHFVVPNFEFLDLHNILGEDQIKKIKPICEDIVFASLETHLQYRDKYEIDYTQVSKLTPFVSEHNQDMFKRATSYKKREEYETINENLRNLYNNRIKDRPIDTRAVQEEMDKLKKLLNGIIENRPISNDERLKDKSDYHENRQRVLKKQKI